MRATLGMALASMMSTAAMAAETAPPDRALQNWELRLGGLYHDAGLITVHKERGADINGELLFPSPGALDVIGAPRPHLGASINTLGQTSQVYAGLTWGWDLPAGFFIEASLGGAIHNGHLDKDDPARKALGSVALFRESISLGWRITMTDNISVMIDHVSNANLASHNAGLDTVGLRWGHRF